MPQRHLPDALQRQRPGLHEQRHLLRRILPQRLLQQRHHVLAFERLRVGGRLLHGLPLHGRLLRRAHHLPRVGADLLQHLALLHGPHLLGRVLLHRHQLPQLGPVVLQLVPVLLGPHLLGRLLLHPVPHFGADLLQLVPVLLGPHLLGRVLHHKLPLVGLIVFVR